MSDGLFGLCDFGDRCDSGRRCCRRCCRRRCRRDDWSSDWGNFDNEGDDLLSLLLLFSIL